MSTYTPKMVEQIRSAAAAAEDKQLNMEKARELAEEFGLSYRSVIAKALSEGIPYKKAEPKTKKPKGQNKADTVRQIADALGADADKLASLDKATAATLAYLLDLLPVVGDDSAA